MDFLSRCLTLVGHASLQTQQPQPNCSLMPRSNKSNPKAAAEKGRGEKETKAAQLAKAQPVYQAANSRAREASAVLDKTISAVKKCNRSKRPLASKAGCHFEDALAGSFDANAVLAGSELRAVKDHYQHRVKDINIHRKGKVVKSYQAKNTADNAKAVLMGDYDSVGLVVPTDTVTSAKASLREKGQRWSKKEIPFAKKQASRADAAAKRLTDKISAGNVSSDKFTTDEMKRLARGDLVPLVRRKLILERRAAVKNGAIVGAVVGGTYSAVRQASRVRKGEVSAGRAFVEVAKATAVGAAEGGAWALGAQLLKEVVTKHAPKAWAKGTKVMRTAPALVLLADLSIKAYRRELTVASAIDSTVECGSAWAGAELGALAGSLVTPGLGTAAGALVGGLVGALGGERLFKALWRGKAAPTPARC